MNGQGKVFAVASDEALVDLICRATKRLVVIAPALTRPVAEALARRLDDLGHLNVTIILDTDPEVYRLGFGDTQALETIRAASAKNLFDLREQPGIRIGIIISDNTTMVYAPVSQNIEAGSTTADKPNAIVLTGGAGDCIASAAGADTSKNTLRAEVGATALPPSKVAEMQSDLKANPPRPFDITRRMNIFSSKVKYVELTVYNYQFATRQIPLPPEFLDMADDDLKKRITSRIRSPLDEIGPIEIKIDLDGKPETILVDDQWLRLRRKQIEEEYTYAIKDFGRVIFESDTMNFDGAIERFKSIIQLYQEALSQKLSQAKAIFEERIVREFALKWEANLPPQMKKYRPTPIDIRIELQRRAQKILEKAISFEKPRVRVLYKIVAPETIRDAAFLKQLKDIMVKRWVPKEIIASLFETGQAAPEAGTFESR